MIITDRNIKTAIITVVVIMGVWLNLWSVQNLIDTEKSLQLCENYIEQINQKTKGE